MAITQEQRDYAFDKLQIPKGNNVMLIVDGGGIRGILTIQLLKKIEEITKVPCFELVDFIAGTSTGGIIAGLLATGHTAIDIEGLYEKLVKKVFTKRNLISNRIFNPPLYDKKNFRKVLKEIVGDITLEAACQKTNVDLMITAKDVSAGEETFFSCVRDFTNQYIGTYKDVLLRAVMEGTSSAPTYFNPLERFVDGGTTTYNNPTLAAIMEALHYKDTGRYNINKLTVINLGTGTTNDFLETTETLNPSGLDSYFWLNYVMRESSQDAAEMQVNFLRSNVIGNIDFRRFQLSLDENVMRLLPDKKIPPIKGIEASSLKELRNKELKGIDLDDVTRFPLMQVIGESMVEFIMNNGAFTKDLVNARKKDLLITPSGAPQNIQTIMKDANWLDKFSS